jgi:hypothetical protein
MESTGKSEPDLDTSLVVIHGNLKSRQLENETLHSPLTKTNADLDSSLIVIQGSSKTVLPRHKIDSSAIRNVAESEPDHTTDENQIENIPEDVNEKNTDQLPVDTKNEIFDIAGKILAAASEKTSSEVEKKLIAAVMTVHMKYAESLSVIEKLIQDRQKIDERVKFLESQLKRDKKKDKGSNNTESKQNQSRHEENVFSQPERLKKFSKEVDVKKKLYTASSEPHTSSRKPNDESFIELSLNDP